MDFTLAFFALFVGEPGDAAQASLFHVVDAGLRSGAYRGRIDTVFSSGAAAIARERDAGRGPLPPVRPR